MATLLRYSLLIVIWGHIQILLRHLSLLFASYFDHLRRLLSIFVSWRIKIHLAPILEAVIVHFFERRYKKSHTRVIGFGQYCIVPFKTNARDIFCCCLSFLKQIIIQCQGRKILWVLCYWICCVRILINVFTNCNYSIISFQELFKNYHLHTDLLF